MCSQVIKLVHILEKTDGSVGVFKNLSKEEKERALKLTPTETINGVKYIEYFTPKQGSIVYLRLLEEDIREEDFKTIKRLMDYEDISKRDLVLYKNLMRGNLNG